MIHLINAVLSMIAMALLSGIFLALRSQGVPLSLCLATIATLLMLPMGVTYVLTEEAND
jgi:hypothetical protein